MEGEEGEVVGRESKVVELEIGVQDVVGLGAIVVGGFVRMVVVVFCISSVVTVVVGAVDAVVDVVV